MNDAHRKIIVKLKVDLAGILEQIFTAQEWEYASLVSEDGGFENSKASERIHKNITILENAEMNIQHAIDLLSSVSN